MVPFFGAVADWEALAGPEPGSGAGAGGGLLAEGLALSAQEGDLGLEVLEGVERAVDGGEAQVGDLVELAQRAEDGQANLR